MGAGVGRGYLFDEEKTRRSFVANPLSGETVDRAYATGDLVKLRPDGNYDFVGRKDHQVKFMGYRIELGEIEAALNSLDYVSSSAAIGIENQGIGGIILVAFVVYKQKTNEKTTRDDLNKRIPHYMIPKVIVELDKLPLNDNGKIDRNRLRNMYKA
jgi:acyl-coenzyme A synthetase/AMP-(fatty) acid ligase